MSAPSDADLTDLKFKFFGLDTDGNWTLSFEEIRDFLHKGNPGLTEGELRAVFEAVDTDGSGQVDFDEFVNYLFPTKRRKPGRGTGRRAGNDGEEERSSHKPSRRRDDNEGSGRVRFSDDGNNVDGSEVASSRTTTLSSSGPYSGRTWSSGRSPNSSGRSISSAEASICDWCQEPICHEVVRRRSHDGCLIKKLVADSQVSLRLPGMTETVTLHAKKGCRDDYIFARALHCVRCSDPIVEDLVVLESPRSGEQIVLHETCEPRYSRGDPDETQERPAERESSERRHRSARERPAERDSSERSRRSAREREQTRGPASPQRTEHNMPSALDRGSVDSYNGDRCDYCRRPFTREQTSVPPVGSGFATTTTQVTVAKTRLQLPGLSETVVLCSDGPCVTQYIEAKAKRCHQCRQPIQDHLTSVQLPFSQVVAILHGECEEEYVAAYATPCDVCRRPIRDNGFWEKRGGRERFLHEHCKSRY